MTAHRPTDDATVPVAFVAVIDHRSSCEVAIQQIGREVEAVSHAGADHLRFLWQRVEGEDILIAMMDLNGAALYQEPIEAWQSITQCKQISEHFSALEKAIRSHPRHAGRASLSPWVEAETICKLRLGNAAAVTGSASWHAAVTGLKIEKEAEYRLLHDNVWPGVMEAIGASNISRFDIFLVELGDNQPYLFYQFLYTGQNFAKDMESQSSSLVNQRWWKFTDKCQQPLPQAGKDSPWLDMKTL